MKTTTLFQALLAASLLAGCHREPKEQAAETSAPTEPKITGDKIILPGNSPQLAALAIEPAQPSEAAAIKLNGRLVWDDDVTVRVFTPFAGRIVKIDAEIGEPVKKDDTLATIASPDFGQAQADVHRAASALSLSQRNVARLRELFEHGAAPQKDLHAAEADLEQAKSEHERASARLKFFGGSINTIDQTFQLRAPLGGIVVEKNINPGQEVRPDQMLANAPQLFAPLFLITDPKRLWVLLDATEQDLPRLKAGTPLTVRSRVYPSQTFTGRIDVVSDSLDPNTRTVKVRGSIDNAQRLLKAEMFVTVELPGDKPMRGVDVSTKAVFLKGDKHYVFLGGGKGEFSRREIKIGMEHDGKVLVLDGIEPGQNVVTDGCLLLEQLLQSGSGS